MPKECRLLYRADGGKKAFDLRLREEGRWKEFVTDRNIVRPLLGPSTPQHDRLLLKKYAPGTAGTDAANIVMELPMEKTKDIPDGMTVPGTEVGTKGPSDAYRDKLPNGCPLWDRRVFSKNKTRFYDDVMWTEENLARNDITEENLHEHCPSLSCARYFWTTRFTSKGFTDHCETVSQFTSRDKNALSNESKRRDSGGTLQALSDFLSGLAARSDDEYSGDGEDE